MAEVLDIIVRQRGARRVAKDIAQIGVSATTASNTLKRFQQSLNTTKTSIDQVSASSQKFSAACAKTSRCTNQAAAGIKRSATSLSGVGTAALVAGGALTAGFLAPLGAAITSAGQFQQAMNLTGVLLNVDRTSAAFKELEEISLELGRTTQFTAVQAAEGLQFLAKTGLDTNQAIAAIPETLKIAAAASIDLGRASDITTNILRGFRLDLDELPAAVDTLAATFSSANVDIEQLASSFVKVGPVAAEFGQEFQDVAAIVGSLGDAGVQAEEAGTALRRIFINLEQDAAKSTSILKKFGISIRDDVTGEFRPLIDIFQDIAKAPIEPAQRIRLFGARALAAAGIIENSSDTLRAFAETVGNQVGRAAEIGEARLFGFNGATIQLNSALEGLGIAIVKSGLLDFLTKIVLGLTRFVRAVANLPRPILAIVSGFLALAAALASLLVPVGLIALGISTLAPIIAGVSFAGIAATVGSFAVALGAVIAPIAAVGAALFLLRDRQFKIGDSTVTLRALVEESFARISEVINVAVEFWKRRLDEANRAIRDFIDGASSELGTTFQNELDSITFNNFLSGLLAAFTGGARIIFEFLSTVAIALAGFSSDIVDFFGNIPAALKAAVLGDFERVGELLGGTFQNGFVAQFDGFGERVGNILLEEGLRAQRIVGKFGESAFITGAAGRVAGAPTAPPTPGVPGPGQGPPTPELDSGPAKAFGEEQLRALNAVNQLTAGLSPGAEAVLRMNKAVTTLNEAVKVSAISADDARLTFDQLRMAAGTEFVESIDPVAAALGEQKRKLEELTAVSGLFGLTQEQTARAQELILEQTDQRLLQLDAVKEKMTDLQSVQLGVTEGVKNFAAETGTQFDIISQGVTRLGGTISSQLTQAVKDGAFSFRDFALSVVQSIQEIITKLLVQIALQTALNALSKGGGGGTIVGAATSVIGGAAQEGATIGPAATGQAFLVGEGGEPELFKPKVTGDIIPAAATADMLGGGAPPEVNVQVVNVDDNSSVPDAMSTREGEQVVLNIIQRNKNTLREIIA